MGIELNNDQIYAIYDLEHWWKRGDKQLFEITGGAGCGKRHHAQRPAQEGFRQERLLPGARR